MEMKHNKKITIKSPVYGIVRIQPLESLVLDICGHIIGDVQE